MEEGLIKTSDGSILKHVGWYCEKCQDYLPNKYDCDCACCYNEGGSLFGKNRKRYYAIKDKYKEVYIICKKS